MGHGHGHGQAASAGGRYTGRLAITVGIGAVFMVVELVVGALTGSLALISDGAHMFTDVLGSGMALAAIVLGGRAAATSTRTFGMYRAEVLAALANAVLLFAVAGYVVTEAVGRLADPPEVPGGPVMIAAGAGLLANLVAFRLLREGAGESLNVRGAYLEVVADLIGSAGVLVSGLVTVTTGWRYADPVIGVAIGLFVLPRAASLGRGALRILFQHAPDRLDVAEVDASLRAVAGVGQVHDIHVWTLTSGMEVASAHLAVDENADPATVLAAAQRVLREGFAIDHATLQVEPAAAARDCERLTW